MTKYRLVELVLVNQHNFNAVQECSERQFRILNKITEKYNISGEELLELSKLKLYEF